jgi:hypothetical protein
MRRTTTANNAGNTDRYKIKAALISTPTQEVIPVDDHDAGDPVESPGEVDDAGQQSEEKAGPRDGPLPTQRPEQWCECDPTDGWVTVSRKTESEKNAGSGG